MFASAFNGAPVITGSANVGIVAMTGVGSRFVTGLGGIIFLAFAVFPKLAQLLALIPNCVMAGAVLVMCGQISASGLRVISMGDFTERNTTILAIALAIGIGGNFGVANLAFLRQPLQPFYRHSRYGPGCPCAKHDSSKGSRG